MAVYPSIWYLKYNITSAAELSPNLPADLPALTIWGTKDFVAIPSAIKHAHNFIAKLEDVPIEGKGHWILLEAKDDVTEKVTSWLHSLSIVPVHQGKL